MGFQLCHAFIFVDNKAAAHAALAAAGLPESFERSHPGQGTANLCSRLGNSYLELLWVDDEAELASAGVVRTRLGERSRWRETGACPFGFGLTGRFPFPAWEYRPPYLPDGPGIPVALASEDPRQPFLFRSPGGETPGTASGMGDIVGIALDLPAAPSPALKMLAEDGLVAVKTAVTPRLLLSLSDGRKLSLPDFVWV